MKKIIYIIFLAFLFVSCKNKNFTDYYNKQKFDRYFSEVNYRVENKTLYITTKIAKYEIYIIDTEKDIIKFREKIDAKMKLKHIDVIYSSNTNITYSNYDNYTLLLQEMNSKYLPKNKYGIAIIETYNFNILPIAIKDLKSYFEKLTLSL